ncbi:MAG: MFS transporter [Burkholderiales bacterium]
MPLLLTLAAVQFTHIVDFMIIMPLGPQFMRLFAIGPQEFGFMVSAYTFAAAASGFVAAFWIDRFDRRRALLWLYAGFIVATALCGVAPGYSTLLLARIVAGTFGGVLSGLTFAIVADLVPYARRATATAVVAAAFSLAAVAGVPLSLWIAAHYSWRAPFLVLAAFSILVGLAAMRLIPPLSAHVAAGARRRPVEQLRAIFGVPNHRRAFALITVLMCSVFTIVPFIAAYNVANVGVAEVDLAVIYFAGGAASLVRGRSMDFDDLRAYVAGDEVKDIDWKATARHVAARLGRRAVGAALRIRSRPVRPRDRIGHRQRRAEASRQLHELQRVAPAAGVGNRVARGGPHHRACTRRRAHAFRRRRLAVGRLHVAMPVARPANSHRRQRD